MAAIGAGIYGLHSSSVSKTWAFLASSQSREYRHGSRVRVWFVLTLSSSMSNFPRWPGLKHFNSVSNIDFSDGQAFLDIMKVGALLSVQLLDVLTKPSKGVLYACVALLGPNDAFVHLIRSYQRYRIMIGMKCVTDDRLERLQTYISTLEKQCDVSLVWALAELLIMAGDFVDCVREVWSRFRVHKTP
jgi:hypothetical protein